MAQEPKNIFEEFEFYMQQISLYVQHQEVSKEIILDLMLMLYKQFIKSSEEIIRHGHAEYNHDRERGLIEGMRLSMSFLYEQLSERM